MTSRTHKIVKSFCTTITRNMPKNRGKGTSNPEQHKETEQSGAVVQNSNGTFTINILAKPAAKNNAITAVDEESVGIQIAAPPVDGEANTELVKYLSKVLSIRKSDINLEKGSKSRMKSVTVTYSSVNREEILQLLRSEIKK